jgi:iron complex outermembrane receptor protein
MKVLRWTHIVVAAIIALSAQPQWAIGQGNNDSAGQHPGGSQDFKMPDLEVNETPDPGPVQESRSEPASISVVPKKSIETFGGPAQTSPYKVLNNLLPSVNAESIDPYGLVNDGTIRIRGQSAFTFGSLSQTLNGLPIGVSTGQGSMGNIIDLENIDSLAVSRGPIPADKGLGFGDAAGALELHIQEPGYAPSTVVQQKYGSFGFTRSYARLDSGELPTKSRVFGSFSYSEETKWRGTGDLDRFNLMGGIVQPLAEDRVKLELYGLYNKFRQDEFRPLTYAQTQDTSYYRGYDFSSNLTGTPKADYTYYGYNRQYFEEWATLGNMEINMWQGGTFTFKPYYAGYTGRRYTTAANTSPMKGISTNLTANDLTYNVTDYREEQFGYLTQFEQKFHPFDVKIGYWYQNMYLFPPAPASSRVFALNGFGSYFQNWGSLADIGDRVFHSPFIQTKTDLDRWHVVAGLRYFQVDFPSVTAFNTTGVADGTYDDVLDRPLAVNAVQSVKKSVKSVWLPNGGLSFDLTDTLTARFMYGRTYACPPQGPFYNGYLNNAAKFAAAGVSLQHLWDKAQLETADNFDLGLRYNNGTFSIAPTLFYSKHDNKQVTVYDSLVNANYSQTNAKAESMGAELETSWKAYSWLTLFGSGSYNRFQFTDNLHTSLNTTLHIKGNQVPDIPLWQVKLGFTAQYKNFSATPLYRYMDSRYGDIQNREQVNGYHILDLHLAYDLPEMWKCKEATLTLDFQNLLDQRYIAVMRNSDDSQSTSISYFPGAPFTVVAGLRIKF